MKTAMNAVTVIIRVFFVTFINSLGVYFLSRFLRGVEFDSLLATFYATLLIGLLSAVILPVFNRFALPLTVLTLGFGSLIMNGIVILGAAALLPGFHINDLWSAIILIFGITLINTAVHELLAIDDDDSYFRNVIKKQAKKPVKVSKVPGVIFLQIDGLAHDVLRRAIQSGNVPTLSKWIRNGSYRLEKWETDWSSQTGASQAGILMGNNKNIPAFRWYDKKTGKTPAFSSHTAVQEIEKRASNGRGLLFHNGASRGNLLSGDAEYTLLTISAIGRKDTQGLGHGYFAYFSNPYNLPRTIILFFIDIGRELSSMVTQKRRDVWPRLTHHDFSYPVFRSMMTVLQRDIIFQTMIGDVFEGRDTIYADVVGYDEVAHHTGPERFETMGILRDIDKQIRRLDRAIQDSPRKYHIVILSDHGQSQGATYKTITGQGLDDFIRQTITQDVSSDMKNVEDSNMVKTATLEITRAVSKKKLIPKEKPSKQTEEEVKVLASGSLGLIYFTKYKHRLKLEEINKDFPGLIDALKSQPLVGFLLVDTKDGGVVLGRKGKYFLKSGTTVGKNPLAPFGPNAIRHVKRTHSFENCGDIMVNGYYDPILGEISAFEELVGSHGGMGGDQAYPFVMFPSNWKYPSAPIIGAENIHVLCKSWLKNLGQKV